MDIWRGFVLHYDGKSWKEVVRANFNSQFINIRKEKDDIFLFSYAVNYESPGVLDIADLEFYQLNGKKFKKIYSNKEPLIAFISLEVINGKCYFVMGNNIYKYILEKFIKCNSIENDHFGYQICGRSDSDFFLSMKDGLAHYNGTDIEYLYRFPKYSIMLNKNSVLFEKEVFFAGLTRDFRNVVLHGVIQE
ncbi:MAG TPA: hypothetical protein ENN90_10555 [Mariniphaga anaerophila]|uniref:Uncharacterized protein n=1 Tax=Mariniphaga anaerophila TaxID=1484053 RepID=A0A831LR66_9BACT|nr:hypothetical protein [Mariniphaga anaerophila]